MGSVDANLFREREAFPRYRPSRLEKGRVRLGQTEAPANEAPATRLAIADDDRMDIDEGDPEVAAEEFIPLHARDSLHAQMAEHFTLVLRDLAFRCHRECGDSLAVTNSAHAPAYRRLELRKWTAGLCLAYLETKKAFSWKPWMASGRGKKDRML